MDTNDSLPTTPSTDPAPVPEATPARSVRRRRRFTIEQKRQIVQDTLASGESFSAAARRQNVNANLLFKWRQQYEPGQLDPEAEAAQLVPVTLTSDNTQIPASHPSRFPRTGRLEIALANGHRLTITGSPCTDTPRGARASATCFSLVEMAKANGLEPYAYLNHVLAGIGSADTLEKLEALLPWNVAKTTD